MSYSKKISQFITEQDYASIPMPVIERAKLHILDTLGVALAGSAQTNGINGQNGVQGISGSRGECKIWGSQRQFSPTFAALANGISAHALDFDDTHTDSIAHGSAVLVPTIMALAEDSDLDGIGLLTAYVIGWEITARVGLASKGSFHQRGFHSTAIAGLFGAVGASAYLLRLTPEQCAHAIGLAGSQASGVAGSQASGVAEYLSNSSSAKCFHAGWSAHSAIIAAGLARAGMTGPMTIFEGRYGLYKTHGDTEKSDSAAVCADLGQRWEMMRVSIKPYPCCHFAHASVDCARMLRQDGITPDDIKSIHCVVDKIAAALICEPLETKFEPKTPYAAKFSLPFLIASGIYDDKLNLGSFRPEALGRNEILALSHKVSYRYANEGEIPFPTYFPGLITVTLKNGETLTKRLDINYGNPKNPMNEDDVERKFRDNVAGILTPQAGEDIINTVRHLERHRVKHLASLMTQVITQ